MKFPYRVIFTLGFFVIALWASRFAAMLMLHNSFRPIPGDQLDFQQVILFGLAPIAALLATWEFWKYHDPNKGQKKGFDFVRFGIYSLGFIVLMIGALQTLKLRPFPWPSYQNQTTSQQKIIKI